MAKNLRTLEGVNIQNKTVILRADYDVPISNGEILDDTKIKASIPTLQYLIKNNCKIVIISHLGNPEGEYKDELSLMPVRFVIGRLLEKQIKFANIAQCENSIKFMDFGDVLLLENVKFFPEETSKNDKERRQFVKKFADMADLYINDSFEISEKYASVYELAKVLKSYAGLNMQAEIETLTKVNEKHESPYVGIFGGSDITTKVKAIDALIGELDIIMIGGDLAYTFLKASGVSVGKSKYDEKQLAKVEKMLAKAKKKGTEIMLPIDHLATEELKEKAKAIEVATQQITKSLIGGDIGPRTLVSYREVIEAAKTIIWDGEMGKFQYDNFSKGTEAIAEYIALSTPKDAVKIVGGNSTTFAITQLKIKTKRFTHISTGGQMMIKFIAKEESEPIELLKGKLKE